MSGFSSQKLMEMEHTFGAHNYHPLEVVISKAEGIWVEDPEGKKYMDCLSAYSAVNQGHRHPLIIKALKDQADICLRVPSNNTARIQEVHITAAHIICGHAERALCT